MLKRLLVLLIVFVIIIVAVLLVNTLHSKQSITVTTILTSPLPAQVIDHLQQLTRFKTISYNYPGQFDSTPFLQLHQYLQQAYPLVHQQ